MSRRLRASLAVTAVLAGCVRLSEPAPVIRDYRLAYSPPAIAGAPLPVIVRVLPLRVAAIYDRQSMVYRSDSYATGTYFYSRWSANPGNMIADLLVRDLAASGLYRTVQHGPAVLVSDYQLTGEIQEIEERASSDGCAAHLRLRMQLLRAHNSHTDPVLLDSSYEADDPCPCGDPRALAEAMSRALDSISVQLQEAVADRIRTAAAASRPASPHRAP